MKIAAFLGLFLLGIALEPNQPKNDDNRFYVPAAIAYVHGDFTPNHEHPPVGKLVMGLGWLAFHGITDNTTACRIPIIALWAWTCVLLYGRVRQSASTTAAAGATAAFVLLPRVLFDAHAETLDFTVTSFIFAGGLAFERGERVKATIFYALACGTKLNAPFAIAAAVTAELLTRRDWKLMTAVALGSPALALVTWPWLWHDTAARLAAYIAFHVRHYPIYFYFFGHLYGTPPAPWYAPLKMLLLTTPVVTLVLAALGVRKNRFALLQIGFQLAAVCAPGVPKYAGVKLFIAIFPWLCVLAGDGLAKVLDELPLKLRPVLATLVILPALVSVIAYRGYWLTYYNELTRIPTAYETQYYDLAYPALRDALRNANASKVAILPNPKEYGVHLTEWGFTPATPLDADTVVITHERRWPNYWQHLAAYRTRRISTHRVHGIPLFSLFSALPETRE